MAVSGFLGKGNLGRPHIHLLLPDEIYAGRPVTARLRLRNDKRLPVFLLRVSILDGSALFLTVGGRETAEAEISLNFPSRGRRTIDGARLSSIFPVNFFVRSRYLPLDQPVLVFPPPRPVPLPEAFGDERRLGEKAVSGRGPQGEPAQIAGYRGGEPLKLIHWKLSARTGRLLVKELAATAVEPVVIDPEQLPGGGLEERLQGAAYLVNRYVRAERPVGLRLGGRLLRPGLTRAHRLRLLAALGSHGQD